MKTNVFCIIYAIDGTLCERCGSLMEDLIVKGRNTLKEPPGHPRLCNDCEEDLS